MLLDAPSGQEGGIQRVGCLLQPSVSEVGIMQPWMLDPCLEASRHPPPHQTSSGPFHIYGHLTIQILRTYPTLGIITQHLPSPHSAFSTNVCPSVPVDLKDLYPSFTLEGQIQPSQPENPALAKGKASSRNILIHHLSRRTAALPEGSQAPHFPAEGIFGS